MSSPVQKTSRRPRGRPRAYDPEVALARATQAFWRHGFSGTSLDALTDAMDMNRPSLYAAFGDKRELYVAALDRYVALSSAQMAERLADDVPLADALQSVYDAALALYFRDAKTPLGCFLIGTAATEAAGDAGVRKKLGSGLRELTRAFERRFRADGRRDAAFLADMASAVLFSIALRARAGDSRASLRAFARKSVALLCSLD